jgi:hypothetical protein
MGALSERYLPDLDSSQRMHLAAPSNPTEEPEELEAFWAELPEPWRVYGQLRLGEPGDPVTTLESAARFLGETHFLVLYPAACGTYVWHLDPGGRVIGWRCSKITRARLQDFCSRWLTAVSSRQAAPADTDEVVRDLLGRELETISAEKAICFISDGPLAQFPFSALPVMGAYLVERHPIAMLPSVSILAYWFQAEEQRPAVEAMVLGDSLGDLPGAREEAAQVARFYGRRPILGSEVTRNALPPRGTECGLLHIACHAFFNQRDPELSGFQLADRTFFSARDLVASGMHVRAAILSACESGLREPAGGGAIAGIGASFRQVLLRLSLRLGECRILLPKS